MKTLFAFVMIVLLSLPALVFAEPTEALTRDFVALANAHRASLKLKPLIYSDEVELVAENHSRRMAQKKIPFGHMGSKLRCRAVINLLELERGTYCGENVAMGQETAEEVFKAWMNSPEHREAIEDDRYTHSGVGFWRDFRGYIYWTQMFVEVKP